MVLRMVSRCHLRSLLHVGFHTELALHAEQYFQVQPAHTGNDGLARLRRFSRERRDLPAPDGSGRLHFFPISLVFGSTACAITGSGNTIRSNMTMADHTGLARGHVLQPTQAMSPARISLTFTIVGVHLEQ
jgi:hypothetical protein